MSSSGDALPFFREWMNNHTKLGVNASLEGVVTSGSGVITSLDDEAIWVWDAASGFSVHINALRNSLSASINV